MLGAASRNCPEERVVASGHHVHVHGLTRVVGDVQSDLRNFSGAGADFYLPAAARRRDGDQHGESNGSHSIASSSMYPAVLLRATVHPAPPMSARHMLGAAEPGKGLGHTRSGYPRVDFGRPASPKRSDMPKVFPRRAPRRRLAPAYAFLIASIGCMPFGSSPAPAPAGANIYQAGRAAFVAGSIAP